MSVDIVECPHFGRPLDFPTECTICSGADAKLKAEQDDTPVFIVTRYQSYCPECDQVIHPGDLIAWFPEHTRPGVHRDCFTP